MLSVKKKISRLRWCRRCNNKFEAKGKWSFICASCNTQGAQGSKSKIMDLRYYDILN